MAAVEARGLYKTYGQGETEVQALCDVSLTVERGELVALLGPSGSGKSTLLTALGLLLVPERGEIWLDGKLVVQGGALRGDAARLRRERMGFVFQKAHLVPFLSALDNVLVAFEINGVRGRAASNRARELLAYLGLEGRMEHMPEQLSGGQQQRVAIARALAMEPPLLLADEPTAALDKQRGRDVMELFAKVAREHGAAVVVVTHDHRSLDVFDAVWEMEDGVLRRGERADIGGHVAP
jgi:putative ABC transport system ATP-binding protein